jgi:hypothetical protein
MKTVRLNARSILGATVSTIVLALSVPVFSLVASATPSNYTASAFNDAIPATLDGIALTQAPSFSGADSAIYELRSTISTFLGAVQLNHTGAFYGNGPYLCFVGCSMGGDQTSSLTFTLPASTTAFAVRLLAQDHGATTYTITGSDGSVAQYAWDGLAPGGDGDRSATLAISAVNGSTIDSVTITATQAEGCTYEDERHPQACSLSGLLVTDAAIGDGVVNMTTTTVPVITTDLASTGSNTDAVLFVGSTLVLFGAVSMLVARRRSHRAH